jgi:hypothetical protein
MADNVGYTPGSGAIISTDEIAGAHHQRVKITLGDDGVDGGTISASNPIPISASVAIPVTASASAPVPITAAQTDNLLTMLSRIVKLLESNAVVDGQQRQRVTIDAGTLPAVTTVATVATVTAVTNMVSNAGMDREQYINIAKQTYAQSIRSRLEFV